MMRQTHILEICGKLENDPAFLKVQSEFNVNRSLDTTVWLRNSNLAGLPFFLEKQGRSRVGSQPDNQPSKRTN